MNEAVRHINSASSPNTINPPPSTLSAEQFYQIVKNAPVAFAILDRELRFMFVSDQWLEEHRLGDIDLIGLSFAEIFPDMASKQGDMLRYCLSGMTAHNDAQQFIAADGSVDWLRWQVQPWRDNEQSIGGLIIVTELITERKQAEEQLRYASLHDPLTGLPNRLMLRLNLEHVTSSNQQGIRSVLLFLDLDRFKAVNDSLGHVAGDQVLTKISKLLVQHIRNHDTLARVGGDEFAVLLHDVSFAQATIIAERMCQAVEQFQFTQDGSTFTFGLSVGIVPIHDRQEAEVLLERADNAMYEAKRQGGSRVVIHDDSN